MSVNALIVGYDAAAMFAPVCISPWSAAGVVPRRASAAVLAPAAAFVQSAPCRRELFCSLVLWALWAQALSVSVPYMLGQIGASLGSGSGSDTVHCSPGAVVADIDEESRGNSASQKHVSRIAFDLSLRRCPEHALLCASGACGPSDSLLPSRLPMLTDDRLASKPPS